MNKKILFMIFLLLLLYTTGYSWTETQYLDVLYLKDGNNFKGIIIEQTPGRTIKLETLNGSVLTFGVDEIDKIVKEQSTELQVGVRYIDVVFLKEGIIFRGVIVEQIPGQSIKLETLNDMVLSFGMDEIWKIAKEKRLEEVVEPAEGESKKIEEMKLQLQMQLAKRKITIGEKREERDRDLDEARDELEEEIQRLKDEMEQTAEEQITPEQREEIEKLEAEIQRLEDKIAKLEAERGIEEEIIEEDRFEQDLEAVKAELQGLMDEIMEITKGMWTEELVSGSGEYKKEIARMKANLQGVISDIVEAAAERGKEEREGAPEQDIKAIDDIKVSLQELTEDVRAISRARRREDVEATKFVLETMMEGGAWRNPAYGAAMAQMALSLPLEDRKKLYEENKRQDALLASGLNLIPGLALGSWAQGDVLGAVMVNILELGGAIPLWLNYNNIFFDESDPIKNIVYYFGGGLLGAGYLFSLIRPYLYVHGQNRRLRDALGISAKPGEQPSIIEVKKKTSEFHKLKRFHLLANLGGFLGGGPSMELGWQLLSETVLGAHIRFIGFSLWNQIANPDGDVALYSIAAGIKICRLFKPKYSPNRVYIGCIIDVDWWDETWEGTVYKIRSQSYYLTIMPGAGYRLRFPSRFFINLGLYFGASIGLYGKSWNTSAPEIVYEYVPDTMFTGNLELSLGWEF